MNDLSQNELLSAYLDGELSAAEQAEVERLLAARPAARQLLDDLRALSATLQSLPQEKLGEDLSQRVLRAAQRRMLAEGKPAGAETSPFAPVPLARSLFRRFVNRRTLAWLGLTAAIVVAISIYDRQQPRLGQLGNRPHGDVAQANRDLARKLESPPAGAAKPAAEPAEWPSIRAKVKEGNASPKVQNRSDGEGAGAPPAAAPAAPLARKTDAANKDEKPASRTAGGQSGARDETSAPNAAPFAGPNGGMGGNGAAMGPANDKSGGTNHLGDEGAYRGPRAAKRKGAFDQAAGESAKAGGAKKAAPATPPVLVVLCDVAPAALQSRAFDKLLDANGVTGHRQPPRRGAAYGAGMPGRPESNGAPALKEKEATAKGQSPTPQAEPEDAIYIEATPAQVKAVLAGLAAQPEVFIAVSAQPVEGRPAEEIVRQYRPARRGDARFRSAVFGARQDHMDQEPSQGAAGPAKSKAPADGKKAEQPPAPAAPALPGAGAAPAAPAPSPAPAGADRKPTAPPPRERAFEQREAEKSQPEKPAEEDRHQQAPRPQRAAQPAPPQRVLFVLRAAGGQPPTASKDSAEKKHE